MLAILGGILVLIGLLGVPVASWLGFIDVGLGAAAVFMASVMRRAPPAVRRILPVGVGIGAFFAFVLGLVFDAPAWLIWWTFAFGCAFVLAPLMPPAGRLEPEGDGTSPRGDAKQSYERSPDEPT